VKARNSPVWESGRDAEVEGARIPESPSRVTADTNLRGGSPAFLLTKSPQPATGAVFAQLTLLGAVTVVSQILGQRESFP
jgi:hypothetical protein